MNIDPGRRTFCAAVAANLCTPAGAQGYPSKAIQVLVPFSPGSLMDVLARTHGEYLSRRVGRTVLIENKPGAGGIAASRALLAMPADGHQVLCISSAHSVNPMLQRLPYDTARDFAALSLWGTSPSVAVVAPTHPAKTLQQLIELARSKPQGVTFGSAGQASGTHLAGEYLALESGIRLLHVPFKGAQEAVNEVLAGRLDVAFPAMGVVIPMVKAGQLRGLGVTSAQRVPQLPDIPTFAESGLKNFDYSITFGTIVSSKTPPEHRRQLAGHFTAIGRQPEVRQRLESLGLVPRSLSLQDFDRYLTQESVKLARIIRDGKVGA